MARDQFSRPGCIRFCQCGHRPHIAIRPLAKVAVQDPIVGLRRVDGMPPDVLAFDNYGILSGASTHLGVFTGIFDVIPEDDLISVSSTFRSLLDEQGGWVKLVSRSSNFRAAFQMADRRPPTPAEWIETRAPSSVECARVRDVAHQAVHAHLQNDLDQFEPVHLTHQEKVALQFAQCI